MRGKIIVVAALLLINDHAVADKGWCFVENHRRVATSLEQDQRVLDYVDVNHRLFARIGVNACMDAESGLKVTAAWLTTALPADPALDKILEAAAAHKFSPWSLLLALNANANARLHKKEEAINIANEQALGPIGDLIRRLAKEK